MNLDSSGVDDDDASAEDKGIDTFRQDSTLTETGLILETALPINKYIRKTDTIPQKRLFTKADKDRIFVYALQPKRNLGSHAKPGFSDDRDRDRDRGGSQPPNNVDVLASLGNPLASPIKSNFPGNGLNLLSPSHPFFFGPNNKSEKPIHHHDDHDHHATLENELADAKKMLADAAKKQVRSIEDEVVVVVEKTNQLYSYSIYFI